MPDTPEPTSPAVPEVRARLAEATRALRESESLDPEARDALAGLLDELGRVLESPAAPPAEVARVADGAAHLAEALHRSQDRGILEAARDRLERLAVQAQTRAPVAVGVARRLIDALAEWGI
jgi:hypothetical protein